MKIIGGKFKNRNFYMPEEVRPTQNVVRKAVFDILGQDFEGKEVLDLFAGSGAMGLEALSRGAKKVVLVEKDPQCIDVLEQNMRLFDVPHGTRDRGGYELLNLDSFAAIKLLHSQSQKFDFIYIDPPYRRDLGKKALKRLEAYDILHPNCVVVIEHHSKDFLPQDSDFLSLFKQRTYGTTRVSFYKKAGVPESD